MPTPDIDVFHKGEGIQMTFTLRERPIPPAKIGLPLSDAGNQSISLVISDQTTGAVVVEFTDGVHIVLNSDPDGIWDVKLAVSDLVLVDAETAYTYDIWSKLPAAEPIHQRSATFMLLPATPVTP